MQANLLFSDEQTLHHLFLQTDLGQLYLSLPFDALASSIPPLAHTKSGLGRRPWFDVRGGIALMVLKHYMNISDELLIERINTDWSMQIFCGLRLLPHERIRDTNLPSWWRSYLGSHLDINAMQQELARYWRPWIKERHIGMQDATCYESYISYPTDIKLLWQGCNFVYTLHQECRRELRLRKSRCNYNKHKTAYLNYQHNKKKPKRLERKLRKQLLSFLLRLLQAHAGLVNKKEHLVSHKQKQRLQTIMKLYEQQHQKAYGAADEKIKDRIVSLHKPYIRPIKRGKETKPVEFGAKVNKLQIDGISFIEHLSFDNFNEGTRLQSGILQQYRLGGKKCSHHSADKIYATNANRSYCRKHKVTTNFIPKGRQKAAHIEQSKQIRRILDKERATRLEGSFGNEKNHYGLQKIKARNQSTEVCWIFFGILASNASIISQRITRAQKQKTRAA